MNAINKRRLVLAGIVAGAVLNVSEFIINEVILLAEWYTAFARLGIDLEPGLASILLFVLGTFGLGIALMWLYAVISRRFGSGARTAVIAAIFLWLVVHFYASLWIGLLGILPVRMLVILTVWALGETILAALVGYGLYRE